MLVRGDIISWLANFFWHHNARQLHYMISLMVLVDVNVGNIRVTHKFLNDATVNELSSIQYQCVFPIFNYPTPSLLRTHPFI